MHIELTIKDDFEVLPASVSKEFNFQSEVKAERSLYYTWFVVKVSVSEEFQLLV